LQAEIVNVTTAQIDDKKSLTSEIVALKAEIETLKTQHVDVAALKAEIETLSVDLATLRAQNSGVQQKSTSKGWFWNGIEQPSGVAARADAGREAQLGVLLDEMHELGQ
jgi:hypothetical protein